MTNTIDEIEGLLARATPLPWVFEDVDLPLMVALRTAAPDLIAVVRAAAKVAKLDDANRPAKAWSELDEALARLGVKP